jgi:hypothetical protein
MASSCNPKEDWAIPPYHEIEIKEVYEQIRSITNLRIQLGTFLGTAHLSILGFALTTQKASIIFIASGILILLVIFDAFARRELTPYYYRGLLLENMYSPDYKTSLLNTYIPVVKSRSEYKHQLEQISRMENQDKRIKALRSFRISLVGFWLPIAIAIVEIIVTLLLIFFAGWSIV